MGRSSKIRAVYPGSFDPVTNGHLDIIERSSNIFYKVIIGVLNNKDKKSTFTTEERVEMIRESVKDLSNVEVASFDGLTIDFVKEKKAQIIIRGLRAVSDYENELKMALANRRLSPQIETFFMMADSQFTFLSSSTIREIASFGRSVDEFLPKLAAKKVREKYNIEE